MGRKQTFSVATIMADIRMHEEHRMVRTRADTENHIRASLVGSHLQKVTYAVTYWELQFEGRDEMVLVAAELAATGQTELEKESKQALLVGSQLLSLTNTSAVSEVSLYRNGDLMVAFMGGGNIRALGTVQSVDWTWSVTSPAFEFTCDGPFID